MRIFDHPKFIPLSAIALVSFLPFLKFKEPASGKWFYSDKGKKASKISAAFAAILTLILVLLSEYVINFESLFSVLPAFISNGIIPLMIYILIIYFYYKYVSGKYKLSLTEAVQAMFVLLTTSFIILTLIGIFFRGVDMALNFPWNL